MTEVIRSLEIWMFERWDSLTDKEKEMMIKFWEAWSNVRDGTGYGEVKVTMQKKVWVSVSSTVHDRSVGEKTVWKKP